VQNYRNIVDSGELTVKRGMTCLVGKNEAGKSAILSAIHALNPVGPDVDLVFRHDYPQWYWKDHQRAFKQGESIGGYGAAPMITGTYEIDEAASASLASVFGPDTLTTDTLAIQRWYPEGSSTTRTYKLRVSEQAFIAWYCKQQGIGGDAAKTKSVRDLRTALGEESEEEAKALSDLLDGLNLRRAVYLHLKANFLPRTLYFSDYSQLDGEYPLDDVLDEVESPASNASASLKTAADFLRLAAVDREGAEADEYEEMTAELRAVSNDLTREMRKFWSQSRNVSLKVDIRRRERAYTENQQGRQVQQRVVDRFLRFEIDDTDHGFQTNLNLRSTGFRWFISFMAAFFDYRDDQRILLLFDEPGLTLHARAQTDLLAAISERVADSRQTIYSTHSPFMVRPDALDQVRIVEDHGPQNGGATVSDSITATDRDTLFPLQAALGYDTAMNLFIGPHNVIVEGTSDFIYLNYFHHRINRSGGSPLRSSATIVPTRGVTKVPAFLSLLGRPQLDLVVVIDGDGPDQALQRSISKGLVRESAVIPVGAFALKGRSRGDIEDLFDTGNYLSIFNACFGTSYEAQDLPEGGRIVKRLEELHGDFNHGEVAEHFLKYSDELSPNNPTMERFRALLQAIDSALPD
jgi:predicted ATPase